jgi:hypothetical protein
MIKVQLGMTKATAGRGNTLPDGKFQVEVRRVFYKDSINPKTPGEAFFGVEFVVQKILLQKPTTDRDGAVVSPVEVGEKRSCTFNKKYPQTPFNVRKFLFAMTGADAPTEGAELFAGLCKGYGIDPSAYDTIEDPWDKIASLSVSEEINPFEGISAIVEVTRTATKFPAHDWSALPAAATTAA